MHLLGSIVGPYSAYFLRCAVKAIASLFHSIFLLSAVSQLLHGSVPAIMAYRVHVGFRVQSLQYLFGFSFIGNPAPVLYPQRTLGMPQVAVPLASLKLQRRLIAPKYHSLPAAVGSGACLALFLGRHLSLSSSAPTSRSFFRT